uniref:Replication protein A 70 kDa DNA-binding subunit n=1 Tax=Syphacia muris TaxID=451379 RepID=A0A0N5AUI1_9BILA
MNFGFLTASGKSVKVSEEALKRAKDIFGNLESENETVVKREADAASNIDASTPTRPLVAKRFCSANRQFKSPVFISSVTKDISTRNHLLDAFPSAECSKSLETSPQTFFNSATGASFKETPNSNKTYSPAVTLSTPTRNRKNCKTATPVKLLTPYCRNWRLCVRVTELEGARRYRETDVFSFLAVDDSGVEVRITAFNELAQKIAKQIEEGKMYYISKALVKPINARFGRNNIDTEIVVRPETEIALCTDAPLISSPKVRFCFVKLKNVENFLDHEIDLIGVIREISEIREIVNKNGEMIERRDLEIVDDTGYVITVLLWGERARTFKCSVSQIIAIKRAFVREYQGFISLTTTNSSKVVIDPDLAETRSLSHWYRNNKNGEFSLVSTKWFLNFDVHKWIGEVNEKNVSENFSIVAMILNVTFHNATYKGCEKCRKKVAEIEGRYRCNKCSVVSDDFKYFYSLNLEVCDFTGTHKINVFNDIAERLLGETADEVAKYVKYDYDRYCSYFRKLFFKKYVFRIGIRTHEGIVLTNKIDSSQVNWLVLDFSEISYDLYVPYLEKCLSLCGFHR